MTPTAQRQRTAETFAALVRHFGFSDERLGELTGYTRSQIAGRRTGRTALDVDDLERFGATFEVPVTVLLGEPADAIRYVLDNGITLEVERNNYSRRWARTPSDLPRSTNGCPSRLTAVPSPQRHAA